MRLTGPPLILETLQRQAQETLRLVLKEAGGDLRQAWELWESVKGQAGSFSTNLQIAGGTMKTVSDHGPVPNPNKRPNPWIFNPDALTLEFYKRGGGAHAEPVYWVDLEECATPAQVLDWIMQTQQKLWATDEVVAGLVRSLWQCLGPKFCFGSTKGRPVNVQAILRQRMPSAPRLGSRPAAWPRRTRKQANK